jgi:hypothetical protein
MAQRFLKPEVIASTALGLLERDLVLSSLAWTDGDFDFTGANLALTSNFVTAHQVNWWAVSVCCAGCGQADGPHSRVGWAPGSTAPAGSCCSSGRVPAGQPGFGRASSLARALVITSVQGLSRKPPEFMPDQHRSVDQVRKADAV